MLGLTKPQYHQFARRADEADPKWRRLWDSLVRGYVFAEGGDTIYDLSRFRAHVPISPVPVAGWALGEGGLGLHFDGDSSADLLAIGTPPGMAQWSIVVMATVQDHAQTAIHYLVSQDLSGWNNDILFGVTPEGSGYDSKRRWGCHHHGLSSGDRTVVFHPVDCVVGQTYIVVCTSDGANLRIYVDGVHTGTAAAVGSSNLGWAELPASISGRPGGGREFDGENYGTFIFNRCLTDAEAVDLYGDFWSPWIRQARTVYSVVGGTPTITPAAASYGYTAIDPVITVDDVIVPAAASYGYTAVDPALQIDVVLTPAAASYGYTAIDPSVDVGGIVSPAPAAYGYTAVDPVLEGVITVTPAPAAYGYTAIDPALVKVLELTPAPAAYGYAALSPTLPGGIVYEAGRPLARVVVTVGVSRRIVDVPMVRRVEQ